MTPAGSQDQRWARLQEHEQGAVQLWVVCAKVSCRVRGRSSLAQLWHPRLWRLLHSCKREGRKKESGRFLKKLWNLFLTDPLELDFKLFTKCLQNAPSGCAPGPGGCTNEMLRTCP